MRGPLGRALALAAAVVIADQATKGWVVRSLPLGRSIPLTSFFALTYLRNTGSVFGLLADAPAGVRAVLFSVVAVLGIGGVLYYLWHTGPGEKAVAAALGGILGGAVGNSIDRLRWGEVVDFLDLHWRDLHWPAFNVADAAITVGLVVVVIRSLAASRRPAGSH